ncbi:hypothetical protein Sjap_005316 [Stephania japonica]|uniref:Uncharacterized protein n=1 Tax=Stephania japonica TaxID=461633 RepID=A0AAP0K5C8_9MAGN
MSFALQQLIISMPLKKPNCSRKNQVPFFISRAEIRVKPFLNLNIKEVGREESRSCKDVSTTYVS